MVQFGAFWGLRRAFLTNENPFCQNNVDSAAYSRIGSYAPADGHEHTIIKIIKWYAVKSPSWQSQQWQPVPWALRWKTNSPKRRPTVSHVTENSKMEMSLYSRSTTVIHHDSPWLIRHETLSVRVWQYLGNRSGSGMYCMHANDLCGESGVFVIRYHHTMS